MNQIHSLFSLRNEFRNELKSIYSLQEIDSIFKLIVQFVMNLSPAGMMTQLSEPVNPEIASQMLEFLHRLKQHEPIQHLLGECEFYGLRFEVSPAVLIPRQESEELVHWILQEIKNPTSRILDIGTGSGCLIISLKNQLPQLEAEAWDKSMPALEIAGKNALRYTADIEFRQIDILEPNLNQTTQFDIILSNPPYVRESERKLMQKNVLDFEPELALFVSDEDPLLFYRRILEHSKNLLKPGGFIYFEINEFLGQDMIRLLKQYSFLNVEMRRDLNGKDRMIRGQKSP